MYIPTKSNYRRGKAMDNLSVSKNELNTHPTIITFDKRLSVEVLDAMGKKVNKEGMIVEKDTGEPVLTKNGETVMIKELAGIKKGSQVFIKNDITSLIEFVNQD